jgi:hypothetical protein
MMQGLFTEPLCRFTAIDKPRLDFEMTERYGRAVAAVMSF